MLYWLNNIIPNKLIYKKTHLSDKKIAFKEFMKFCHAWQKREIFSTQANFQANCSLVMNRVNRLFVRQPDHGKRGGKNARPKRNGQKHQHGVEIHVHDPKGHAEL